MLKLKYFSFRNLFLFVICFFIIYQLLFTLRIILFIFIDPQYSAVMKTDIAERSQNGERAYISHDWVPLEQISENMQKAVIAAEDSQFLTHNGIDWKAIEKALEHNQAVKAGETKSKTIKGGSTITQQVVKNLFLSNQRSYLRKAQELILAYQLDLFLSKSRILEIYLNIAEWGNGIFGIEAAAQHYFKISADKLNKSQSAKLAAMLPNPKFYDENRQTRFLNKRINTIQKGMSVVELP